MITLNFNDQVIEKISKADQDGFRSDCCLAPTQQFFSYIMARTS